MDAEKVFRKFMGLLGKKFDASTKWLNFCEDAITEIRALIRDGEDNPKNEERLNSAAAAFAFYKHIQCIIGQGNVVAVLTPEGESNPDKRVILSTAQAVWENARLTIIDLLKDSNFAFKGVNQFYKSVSD